MSRAPWVTAASLVAIVGVGAGPALAQDRVAELEARIEALTPLAESARIEAEAAVEAFERRRAVEAEEAGKVDTLDIRGATVIAPPDDVEMARILFTEVLSEHFAGVESTTLPAWTFAFQRGREHQLIYVEPSPYVREIEIDWWEDAADSKAYIRSALSHAISNERLGSKMHAWATDDPLLDPDGARVYRTMATAPSKAVRGCIAGSTADCELALGLGVDDDAMARWYTPEERRSLVMGMGYRLGPDFEAPIYGACVELSDHDACDSVLANSVGRLAPLPGSVRSSLASYALEVGGSGAWARFVADEEAAPEDVLPHVAQMPLDDLVAEWRAWVMEERPATYAALGGKSLMALMWILLFGTFATRSTRWRLG